MILTPWLMEPGGSISQSQGLSNNPYIELNQLNYSYDTHFFKVNSSNVLPSTARPSCLKILKALLPSSILATCPTHLNLLDVITLTIVGERYKLLIVVLIIFRRSEVRIPLLVQIF